MKLPVARRYAHPSAVLTRAKGFRGCRFGRRELRRWRSGRSAPGAGTLNYSKAGAWLNTGKGRYRRRYAAPHLGLSLRRRSGRSYAVGSVCNSGAACRPRCDIASSRFRKSLGRLRLRKSICGDRTLEIAAMRSRMLEQCVAPVGFRRPATFEDRRVARRWGASEPVIAGGRPAA